MEAAGLAQAAARLPTPPPARQSRASVAPGSSSQLALRHSSASASPLLRAGGSLRSVAGARGARRPGPVQVQCTAAEADPAAAGVALYNPKSYDVLVRDASQAVARALDAGHSRIEVEFPALPTSISGYSGASDDFIDANIQLALYLAQNLKKKRGTVAKLVLPDQVETRRAARKFRATLEMTDGITLGSLEEGGAPKGFFGQLKTALDFDLDFEAKEEAERWASSAVPDLYILANASATELPAVEAFVEKVAAGTPVVLFNLELDTLRADLGLFGFPPKDVHYRFLAQFLPAFYIRPRDYSKSVAVAPFILNYSGAILRQFPGPWQVMLKQSDGSYACVAEAPKRFTLGQAKEELLQSLGMQEEEGSALQALRRGYKTSTWWEEETSAEKSQNWRS